MAKINCPYIDIRIEKEAPEFRNIEISPELFSSPEWVAATPIERAGLMALCQVALVYAHTDSGEFSLDPGYIERVGTLYGPMLPADIDCFGHWQCWIENGNEA